MSNAKIKQQEELQMSHECSTDDIIGKYIYMKRGQRTYYMKAKRIEHGYAGIFDLDIVTGPAIILLRNNYIINQDCKIDLRAAFVISKEEFEQAYNDAITQLRNAVES